MMSSIDFLKKVIFANLVTYEVLHGQRRSVMLKRSHLLPRSQTYELCLVSINVYKIFVTFLKIKKLHK